MHAAEASSAVPQLQPSAFSRDERYIHACFRHMVDGQPKRRLLPTSSYGQIPPFASDEFQLRRLLFSCC